MWILDNGQQKQMDFEINIVIIISYETCYLFTNVNQAQFATSYNLFLRLRKRLHTM